MNFTLLTYLIYLPVSIGITMIVGHTLFKNGRYFLIDIFRRNEKLADSVNRLLLVGFYLLNIGYVVLNMANGNDILSAEHMIEKLSYKIGVLLLVLGAIHFTNLIVLYRLRKRSNEEEDARVAREARLANG